MKNSVILALFILNFFVVAKAQELEHTNAANSRHSSIKGLRIAAVIGHTYINSEGMDGNLYIPSWGLDIDYWFSHKWGIGMHNDIEIENFVVVRNNEEQIERANPLVFTLDALYHLGNGFVISIGPGVEIEKNESFLLARLGLEYEYDIGEKLYIFPTLFYDRRFDGFSTTTIGFGLGYKL